MDGEKEDDPTRSELEKGLTEDGEVLMLDKEVRACEEVAAAFDYL